MIILDSSAVIHLLNGTRTGELLKPKLTEKVLGVSVITLYEVLRGAREHELSATSTFFESITRVPFDDTSAMLSSTLEKELLRKGISISSLDIFIAATCLSGKHTLATTDKSFQKIPGLSIITV